MSRFAAYDIYGLSEIIGPGVAMECEVQAGPHIFEDYFYPEIIDTKTNMPCPEGEEGELVLTTLSKKAMPMIRYRTRDISALTTEQCECGRTLRRIKRIARRSDALEQLQGKLHKSIETTIGLRANVRLVQPRTLQRSKGKAKRVIDQRKM